MNENKNQIATLCTACAETYSLIWDIRPYTMANATTKPAKRCEQCKKPVSGMKMYYIGKKKKR